MNINRDFFPLSGNLPLHVGIDKVILTISDFQINSRDGWLNSIPASLPGENPEDVPPTLICRDGTPIKGKLYANTETAQYDIDYRGMRVIFNPSKMYHPYHLTNTGDNFNRAIEHIVTDAESMGIHANIREAKISRLDIAAQAEMSRPPGMYADAYKLCNSKRMPNQAEYPGGYRMGSKSVATICYDKAQEIKVKDKTGTIKVTENNLLRVENRWQKSDAMARHLQFNSLPILLKMHPEDIRQKNSLFLRNKVFKDKKKGEQLLIDFDTEVQVLQSLMSQYKRGFAPVLAHLGMAGGNYSDTLSKFGSIEGYFNLMMDAGISKSRAYEHKTKLMELIRTEARINRDREQITPGKLLDELIHRFAA
jgi:hypothetical protein